MKLKLDRPMICFDLETTGLNPSTDRIIEMCLIKVYPNGDRDVKTRRINPEQPIGKEASEITGIKDEDVKDSPTFAKVAKSLLEFLDGCDLSGYNLLRFDVPVLVEEFKRVGLEYDLKEVQIVDVQRIFHKKEARTLEAALKFYCDKDLEGAHAAENDVIATLDVLEGQLERYDDLEPTLEYLAAYTKDDRWADQTGRLHWVDGEAAVAFGKHKGTKLSVLVRSEPGFLKWILGKEFPEDVKKIVRDALEGKILRKEA